ISQPIDHNGPWSSTIFYNGQVQVRTSTPISVLVKDKYGNPVDNRNVVEKVKFDASSKGVSGFQSGASWVKSLTVPVNESGYAQVMFMADLGTNYVYIDPPSPIWYKLISITGLSEGTPFSVTSAVSPTGEPYPYTKIKEGTFTIAFTFLDRYGYPVLNQPVNISTNIPGEEMSLLTNKYGLVMITYGPKDIAGIYTITARAANNLSVSASPKVEFVSSEPVNALLTASPQTMASRDVKDDITSTLIMRVMDVKGNPVAGETVTFRFKNFDVPGMFNQTQGPILENGATSTDQKNVDIMAVSDEDGEARVTFHPGAFSTDYYAPKYNASATGKATVEAQWSNVKRQMELKYINYPYLTIESEVNPSIVRVNETVDLTIRVRGDGWALQPKPIDVMLVTDRSGSMYSDLPDRLVSVTDASLVFSGELDYSRDRLGLVSFGGEGTPNPTNDQDCGIDGDASDDASYAALHYPVLKYFNDHATLDQQLTGTKSLIDQKIREVASVSGTPMRYGIYKAIYETRNKWNPNSIRALIVLSDGDWNKFGDPLARLNKGNTNGWHSSYDGSDNDYWEIPGLPSAKVNQSMSNYANINGIKLFTIAFSDGVGGRGRETLRILANETGGKYYFATATDVADVYRDIAGMLREEAGVNTTMNLSFQNIVVGNVTMPGDQVYSYQRIAGRSTKVNSWNETMNPIPGFPAEYDSTNEWNASRSLNFFIGTIRLGQVWQSTVSLKVLHEGTINVFNASSKISVEGSSIPLRIPDVFITALPNNTGTALTGAAHLSIDELHLTNEGSTTSADLRWNLSYDGLYDISEDLMISQYGLTQWDHIYTPLRTISNATPIYDTGSINIASRPYGYYTIRLEADAYDSNPASRQLIIYISDAGVREIFPGEVPVPGVGATPTPRPRIKIT
ncbi:MAG: VWA domain-containing protein, partial [Methanomicrobiales archaeon]|nr:VWA domain-containing protein [Methanomicrobiales archaeon]